MDSQNLEPASSGSTGSTHQSRLYVLIENGDNEGVQELLADAPHHEADLNRALFRAIDRRRAEIVESLIKKGASVHSTNEVHDDTPLHCAARSGNIEIVQYLLGAGALVDVRSRRGETPLLSALLMCRRLDQHTISETSGFYHDFKSLEERAPRRYAKIIRTLVDAGASVYSKNEFGSVLIHAASHKDIDIVRCIVERADDKMKFVNTLFEDVDSWHKKSALWAAIDSRHLNIVRYLVEAGANPLLHLVEAGTDPLPQHGDSRIYKLAIHRAIEVGPRSDGLEIIQYLINVDRRQLEERDSYDNTCLHLAAGTDDAECVDWLLSEGADCTAVNSQGQTPWQVACGIINKRSKPSLAVMGIFLRREIGIIQEFNWDYPGHTSFVPNGESFYWGGGRLIYAALDLQKPLHFPNISAKSYLNILEKINSGFVEYSEMGSALCVREPVCTFETLKDDSGTQFMCLAIPYLSSAAVDFIENRWVRSLKYYTQMKYCLPSDPNTFGADIEVTLDEHCNPALSTEVLKRRNMDQVLTRYGKRLEPKNPREDTAPDDSLRLVTVPQLWCWRIGSVFVLNCETHVHLHLDRSWLRWKGDPNKYMGLILSYIVDHLDRPGMLGLSEPIFSIFSKSISAVAEDVNKYTRSTEFDDISIEKEQQFLHEINDIREEIAMMQTVLFQQEEIWREFTYKTWPQFWPDGENGRFKPSFLDEKMVESNNNERQEKDEVDVWREIAKPQAQFPKYRKRFEKLDEDAERVERYILVQLDLKQKHAAIKETHTTTVMSAAIVGFTVITIIFAPLSFLTSLFALPIDQFQQNQNGKYSTKYIGKWIAAGEVASLAITATAIWLACIYFLQLRITPLIPSMVSKQSLLNLLDYLRHWMPFGSKETDSGSTTQPSTDTASRRSTDSESGHETTNQENDLKRIGILANLAGKGRSLKSRRQKNHNSDVENGN